MKKNLTEIVFILDRSGSMAGLESDTIGGFNAMVKKQLNEPGEALVTTVLFDDRMETIHDRVDLKRIPRMTDKDYWVRGCTALIDAIGSTVDHIQQIHKYIRPEDVPERTIVIITTDGMENASRKYTSDQVKKMIQEKQQQGWEFIFLGANIDAVETAKHFGIREEHAVNYHADAPGTAAVYEAASEAITCARKCAPVSGGWRRKIDKDFLSRK